MQQLKDKLCTNPNAQAELDVAETICDLINDVSRVSPKSTSCNSVLVFSPSTIIDIEDVQDIVNTPSSILTVRVPPS
ncbi:hypothetical protein CEXT_785821 [Caerostris extrusa]|uniref:Uncharacterized protein n=1 Tax=Caerostris extrusa TaxID=172846 RepID=A0AAV4TTF6_CAEEX|nr:hypothetical protein CEXT_785821 [Caerostris extrusa]